MIKYVILFIHLIGLSIYQLFFGDVTASQKIPDKINAGEEVTVEINITKENVNGFAKVQQTLPSGFFAEVIDAKGATFSFKENTVKFIWMALPSENQFTISYILKTTAMLFASSPTVLKLPSFSSVTTIAALNPSFVNCIFRFRASGKLS